MSVGEAVLDVFGDHLLDADKDANAADIEKGCNRCWTISLDGRAGEALGEASAIPGVSSLSNGTIHLLFLCHRRKVMMRNMKIAVPAMLPITPPITRGVSDE